ncbi:ABC transporter permease [Liquorilactobacillus cacaonum]|nr:ABC transporter permease [Liquorilactobacillus cacaonum]
MKFSDLFKVAFRSLLANKRRSLLTMIGIIIGIASVITIIALGNGVKQKMISEFQTSNSGEQTTEISYDGEESASSGFTTSDVSQVKQQFGRELSHVEFKKDTNNISINSATVGNSNVGTSLSLLKSPMSSSRLIYGRNLSKADLALDQHLILLSSKLAKKVYGNAKNALGTAIMINGISYRVKGIFKPSGYDKYSVNFLLSQKTYYSGTTINRANTLKLTVKKGYGASKVTNEVVSYLKKHGQNRRAGNYSYFDEGALLKSISTVMDVLTYFISAIAGISLFIAGIGVMNMMYISVSERTQEIGIRLAVGATQKNILWQFLMESIMLTVGGGLVGFLIGWGFSSMISLLIPYHIHAIVTLGNFLLAFGVSSAVGIIFGLLPATQASKRNLIDILR